MTNPLPTVEFEAPPVPSSGYGLYSAATLFDTGEVARHLGGVTLRAYNCDTGYGTYSTDLCDDAPETKAPGERTTPEDFTPMVVWAASECAPDATAAEIMGRANHLRTLKEPLLVESAFATKILTDAGAPSTAPDLVSAIGILEEYLGELGFQGYIHLSRHWAAAASQYRWGNQSGPVLRSPLGHTYVFGGGYGDVLSDTLVATGPLFIWRSTPFEQVVTTGTHPTAALNNTVYGLSERIVTVAYECPAFAVSVETP